MKTSAPATPRFFENRDEGTVFEVLTPEGVPLHLHVALAGDRLGAFFLDILFIFVPTLALVIGTVMATGVTLRGS